MPTFPPRFDDLQVGDSLPGVLAGPITRCTLDAYAQASGDHNPLHLDPEYARRAGMPDVLAHGMFSAAHLARLLTHWVDQSAIRSLGVRFVAITHLGDEVHGRATVTDKFVHSGERRVALTLTVHNQVGELKLTGTAVVALP